jgi:hypothetical protein
MSNSAGILPGGDGNAKKIVFWEAVSGRLFGKIESASAGLGPNACRAGASSAGVCHASKADRMNNEHPGFSRARAFLARSSIISEF